MSIISGIVSTPGTSSLRAIHKLQTIFSRRKPFILVACMPKSGSTFLTSFLSELTGYRICSLTYAYAQTEQELYLPKLLNYYNCGSITQQHIRATDSNIELMREFSVQPVILVRNIFDIIVSIRDHQYRESIKSPMFFLTEDFFTLSESDQYDLIIELAIPWYINFYVSWHEARKKEKINTLWLSYEELMNDKLSTIGRLSSELGFNHTPQDIKAALKHVSGSGKTRLNKGIAGRGALQLSNEQKTKVENMTRFYPSVDFSPIGIS